MYEGEATSASGWTRAAPNHRLDCEVVGRDRCDDDVECDDDEYDSSSSWEIVPPNLWSVATDGTLEVYSILHIERLDDSHEAPPFARNDNLRLTKLMDQHNGISHCPIHTVVTSWNDPELQQVLDEQSPIRAARRARRHEIRRPV